VAADRGSPGFGRSTAKFGAARWVAMAKRNAEMRALGLSLRMMFRDQALKSIWWMPWHQEAMKDVARCEKPRGGASTRRSVDIRMGKPGPYGSSTPEFIGRRSKPGEPKHRSSRRKGNQTRLR
jgi:hypothetical protein